MIAPSDSDLADQTQAEIISVIYARVSLWHKHALMEMQSLYGNTLYNDLCWNDSWKMWQHKRHRLTVKSCFCTPVSPPLLEMISVYIRIHHAKKAQFSDF